MASGAAPALAEPWTRGFVVSTYDYAFHYGGRPDFDRKGEVKPGEDCSRGSANHFSTPEKVRAALVGQKWRSRQQLDWVENPPGFEQARAPGRARTSIWARALSYRGYKRGVETYINPWAAEDLGQPEVTGHIGEGLNLDGKIGPDDFVSPDGEQGIDNALYRAWGCTASWRGDGNADYQQFYTSQMRDGSYTMVIRMSGDQDPANDSDATVEIGYSPDKIVKDSRSGVAADFSYRILKATQYTRLKARIVNGVVETEQVDHLTFPRLAAQYHQTGEADFRQGRIRLQLLPDDKGGSGLIGGYRDWHDIYAENALFNYGGSVDVIFHESQVSLFYALQRNADGIFNPATGRYDGISTAYRITLVPAFVVDPPVPMDIPVQANLAWRKKAFELAKGSFMKGAQTLVPQDPPWGTKEAAYPDFERGHSKWLPNRAYYLKELDRPHFPAGGTTDEYGHPIDDEGNRIDEHGHKIDNQGDPIAPIKPPAAN